MFSSTTTMACPISGTGPPPPETGAMLSAPLHAAIRNSRIAARGLINRSPLLDKRASSQLDRGDDLVAPGGLLAAENAARSLDQGAGAVQREPRPPGGRDVGEILLHERAGRGPDASGGHAIQSHATSEIGPEMGRIAHRIAQGRGVEVDEHHAVAVQEDVVGLWIPVDRR